MRQWGPEGRGDRGHMSSNRVLMLLALEQGERSSGFAADTASDSHREPCGSLDEMDFRVLCNLRPHPCIACWGGLQLGHWDSRGGFCFQTRSAIQAGLKSSNPVSASPVLGLQECATKCFQHFFKIEFIHFDNFMHVNNPS